LRQFDEPQLLTFRSPSSGGSTLGHRPLQIVAKPPNLAAPQIVARQKIGGGVGWIPDHLGQTNYAEMCILVTKYISRLNKISLQITFHVFNYVGYFK